MFAMKYKQIGAKIIYYRTLKSLSQEELAEKIGITQSFLSKIERGVYYNNLSFTTLLQIAKALDIEKRQVLVASTGVIGAQLPMDKITKGIQLLAPTLDESLDVCELIKD